jgi:hypothetical protein
MLQKLKKMGHYGGGILLFQFLSEMEQTFHTVKNFSSLFLHHLYLSEEVCKVCSISDELKYKPPDVPTPL